MAETRSKYWATIVYPDSVVSGWLSILQSMGLQAVVSPLHDKDVYEYTDEQKGFKKGDFKKPHYHVVFLFDSLKAGAQVKEITDKIKSVGQLKVLSISGTIRYLTHKDCKDKFQYDEKDLIVIGGADLDKYNKTESEKDSDLNKEFFSITNLCAEYQLFEFCDLVDFLLCNEYYEQFKIVRSNSYFWAQYLKSKQYALKRQYEDKRKLCEIEEL